MSKEVVKRLDRIEKKLDDHLERTAKNEVNIAWLKKGFIGIIALVTTGITKAFISKH